MADERPAAEKVVAIEKPAAPEKTVAVEKPAGAAEGRVGREGGGAAEGSGGGRERSAPQKAVAVDKPAPDEKPASPAATPAALSSGEPGACTARIVTEPKDAKVIWNDQVIGRSPN